MGIDEIKPEEEKTQESELIGEHMVSLFHILLQYAGGGMEVPLEVLENSPKELNIVAKFDETNKILRVFIPRKRKKRKFALVTPRKQLFVPN